MIEKLPKIYDVGNIMDNRNKTNELVEAVNNILLAIEGIGYSVGVISAYITGKTEEMNDFKRKLEEWNDQTD